MPPTPGNKEDFALPADALQGLHRALLGGLVEAEEPVYEGNWTRHISPILTGMDACSSDVILAMLKV